MTDDILKKLRNPELYTETGWQELLSLAADRIEELEVDADEKNQEIDKLALEVDDGGDEVRHLKRQIKDFEGEIRNFRERLK